MVTMNLVAPSCLNADGTPPTPTQLSGPGMFDPERPGLFVRANIAELVRVVRLAPGATPSFCAQVQRAARDLGLRVEQSGLAR